MSVTPVWCCRSREKRRMSQRRGLEGIRAAEQIGEGGRRGEAAEVPRTGDLPEGRTTQRDCFLSTTLHTIAKEEDWSFIYGERGETERMLVAGRLGFCLRLDTTELRW